MKNQINATVNCRIVGDYVDEAEVPSNLDCHQGEAVRPRVIASYIDLCALDDGIREFTVLLKDGRAVAVRGHGLKHEPHPIAGQDVFSVIIHTSSEEVLVACFKSADIAGIFHGDVRADRKIA